MIPSPVVSAGTLDLLLPDSAAIDTVRRHPLPFPLWIIGDQCLLYHWFDHAVNEGFEHVRIHVTDRPAAIRQAVKAATLWPIRLEVVTLRSAEEAPSGATTVSGLPGSNGSDVPTDEWALLDHARNLGTDWLEDLQADPAHDLLRIGASCRIHPGALLFPPYFIGDNVFIGPGCEIGPNAIIGSGSMLAGANRVVRSEIAPHTFLGPMTALEDCLLDGGVLFNRRHRARIDRLDSHLSSSLLPDARRTSPTWQERRLARQIAKRLGPAVQADTIQLHDGHSIPGGLPEELTTRVRWLGEVARGKMRLFGVLPRTRAEMDRLPPEWRSALEHAPIGVFSYADCHGCHTPADPDEALHAVYQASLDDEILLPILRDFVTSLQPGGFDS